MFIVSMAAIILACILICPTIEAAQIRGDFPSLKVSSRQEGFCTAPVEYRFGGCPNICGDFSEDQLNQCENGPTHGCSYNLQPLPSNKYCCEYDPRFNEELSPILCPGDSVLFDGIDATDAFRVGYVLQLEGLPSQSSIFDVVRSECHNNVLSNHRRDDIPTTVPPSGFVTTTNIVSPDRFYLCTRSNRRNLQCEYKYTRNGLPIGSVTVKWKNIQGCFPDFSGFSD